jgi:hypothetical protein
MKIFRVVKNLIDRPETYTPFSSTQDFQLGQETFVSKGQIRCRKAFFGVSALWSSQVDESDKRMV